MKAFLKLHGLSIVYLLSISCIPLLWYSSATIGLGHDMGWSLVPVDRFIDRLFAWTKSGFGNDQSLEVGALTIYAIPALLSLLHLPIIAVQKITYIFWFFSMASSMYYFTQSVYKGKYSKYVSLLAATFYILNLYTLQAWTVAEFSKFSAMTVFPILLANLWKVIDKKMSIIKGAIISGIFFFIFNGGGGSGIPLYGGMLITLLLLFVYKWLVEKCSFVTLIKIYGTFGLIIFFVNLYWIIPLVDVIKTQYSSFAGSGGPEATVAWTNVISRNTSLLNLFRLQGFSDWYDTTNHPYAPYFLQNPFLIIASFLLPVTAFISYLWIKDIKEKRLILFISLLALFSMIFVGGTHPPFGFIYAFLMTKVYGFAIFRTAFYKFGYALWFTYALLFAFSLIKLGSIFKNRVVSIGLFIIGILFIAIYNFPFFTGSFFGFDKPFATMLHLPSYITQAESYIGSLPENDRILMIPPPSPTNGESDVYTFGYFSRTPLPFELTQKSVVTNVEVNSDGEEQLTEQLYNAILQNNQSQARRLMDILGISHILVRNDVMTNNSTYRVITPQSFMKNILTYSWITPEKQFNQWSFYHVNNSASQFSVNIPSISFTSQAGTAGNPTISDASTIYISDFFSELLNNQGNHTIFSTCITCVSPNVKVFPHATRVIFLPTSPLYFLIRFEEQKNLKNSKPDPFFHLGFDLYYAERHAMELRQLADSDKEKDESSLDQYQRYEILIAYENLIKDGYSTWNKLSLIQKLQSVSEVEDSLEAQRRLIRSLSSSNFITDNEPTFYHMYNDLNSFVNDSGIQKVQQFKNENLVYKVSIPISGDYSLTSDEPIPSNASLDNNPFSSTTFALSAGDHLIVLPYKLPSLLDIPLITITGKQEKNIPLTTLKKSQAYNLSFALTSNQLPALTVEVVDDLGNNKIFQVISPNSALKTQQISLSFNTNSAVNNAYQLKFLAENEGNLQGSATIQNITVNQLSYPTLTFSNVDVKPPLNTKTPIIHIQSVNQTTYYVTVNNATDPYVLLFRQTFSPLWIAKVNNNQLTEHFSAYNAFNGWYIDAKGNYTITITFQIQKVYIIGIAITIISLLLLIIVLLKKSIYGKNL